MYTTINASIRIAMGFDASCFQNNLPQRYPGSSKSLAFQVLKKVTSNGRWSNTTYKRNPQWGRSKTAPPTSTPGLINPTTFQQLKCRRPIRNLDRKAHPEELCSRGEIFLCDVPTFSEETFELAKRFLCDFDGRCDVGFVKEGLSSEEEVCLVNSSIID